MSDLANHAIIARGRTAEVYAWQDGQVLKLFYEWCPPTWVEDEIEVGNKMAATSLPVPRILASIQLGTRRGIIYERVVGPSMLDILSKQPWQLFALARRLAELHSLVHRQDGSAFRSLRSSLKTTIQRVDNLTPDLKNRVLALLESLPDENALCHFDFHPGQVLLTAKGPVVIDWMTACRGCPAGDLARTAIILRVAQVPGASRSMQLITGLWRGWFLRIYLARYLELHPEIIRKEIATWMAPVAAGRLKEAIPGERDPLLRIIQAGLDQAL